ncbi:hypothetical protein ACIOKD_26340 [Streptomyces sp. NPDC087844]|uniref:ATP-binding protein n=1 Tax=Streptomyces sp. NPDC087844 TaxID=3365805 RepID=UPI0037F92395
MTLDYGRTRLDVTVEDDGGSRAPVPSADGHGIPCADGHGILGMRERAAVAGGSLDARRTTDGFLVTARLPVEDAA